MSLTSPVQVMASTAFAEASADDSPGHGWKLCPCGWRPDFGKHYARPDHVAYQRQRIKAGKPLTMHWPFPVPRGFRRAGKDTITAKATP